MIELALVFNFLLTVACLMIRGFWILHLRISLLHSLVLNLSTAWWVQFQTRLKENLYLVDKLINSTFHFLNKSLLNGGVTLKSCLLVSNSHTNTFFSFEMCFCSYVFMYLLPWTLKRSVKQNYSLLGQSLEKVDFFRT